MSDEAPRGRRTGGRAGRAAARAAHVVGTGPVHHPDVVARARCCREEGLALIEENADTILEQVGIEFRDAPDALELFAGAGADVDGETRPLPARHVPLARPGDRPARVHPARAEPGERRAHRR